MNGRPGAPLFATINVTGVCNLACKYCFNQPRAPTHMTRNNFNEIVEQLSDLKVFFVNISGGEPFTHPEISQFLKRVHNVFQHVMLLTNGTILLESHVKTIRKILETKGRFPIQVSLDSIDPDTNTKTRCNSNRTLGNIRYLSSIGTDLIIAMVISRFNIDHVPASILELSQYTRHFHLMSLQDVRTVRGIKAEYGLNNEQLHDFWHRIHSLGVRNGLHINTPLNYDDDEGCATGAPCMAAYSHVVIEPSLAIRPCDRLVDVTIGNLKDSTLKEIWNSESVKPILQGALPFCRLAPENNEIAHGVNGS